MAEKQLQQSKDGVTITFTLAFKEKPDELGFDVTTKTKPSFSLSGDSAKAAFEQGQLKLL